MEEGIRSSIRVWGGRNDEKGAVLIAWPELSNVGVKQMVRHMLQMSSPCPHAGDACEY